LLPDALHAREFVLIPTAAGDRSQAKRQQEKPPAANCLFTPFIRDRSPRNRTPSSFWAVTCRPCPLGDSCERSLDHVWVGSFRQRRVSVLRLCGPAARRSPAGCRSSRAGQVDPAAPTEQNAKPHPRAGARSWHRSLRADPFQHSPFRRRSAGCPPQSGGRTAAREEDSRSAPVNTSAISK
jgi:hypothetical protein